jgi:hypothetical protein
MKTQWPKGLAAICAALSTWVWAEQAGAPQDTCHPATDGGQAQYVVGYGSLMDADSRRHTLPEAGDGLPVAVQGYERYWGLNGPKIGFGTTFLVARPLEGATMNAVAFRLPDADAVQAYDARERSYCRALVPRESLQLLTLEDLPDGQFWIYLRSEPTGERPSERYPIVQSYVDLFLGGCLELQERFDLPEFARGCVETTRGWSGHWVNDRLHPRRPWVYQPRALSVDRVLTGALPELYPGEVEIE